MTGTGQDEHEHETHDEQRRPVSTALARVSGKALVKVGDAPGAAVVGLWEEAKRSYLGAIAFGTDLRTYRTVAGRRAELAEAKRRADAGAGRPPAPNMLTEIEKEQTRRTRLILAAAAGAAVLLLASSVASYRWDPWFYVAMASPLVLLALGRYYRVRWVTALAPVSTPALLPFGIEALRWWPALVALALVALACEYRGGLVVPPGPPVPDSVKGLSRRDWMVLWATTERVLLGRGKQLTRTDNARPVSSEGAELGVVFGVRCAEPVLPDDVRAVERELGFPVGESAFIGDPAAAGSGELRLLWADPLPPAAMPRREPMSLSYTRPFPIARRTGGRTTELSVNRTRILLAGNSGSGKSQAEQGILDAVCDMPDATWSAIDRQEGPTFKAYAKQWNCTGVYFSAEDALAEVRRLRAWCIARNRRLDEGMDADLDGEIDQWWIVDETGENPDRRGHLLFIDELSSATTDKDFARELTLLLEVCRKASVSVVMATPDLDKDRVPRAVLDQVNTTVGMSCPFSDAVQMFGKGSTQSGWEPYALTPAADDEPNDAGKAFIRGGPYNRPEVHRFGVMDKAEIVARNRARRLWRERFAPADAPAPPRGQASVEVIEAVVIPEPLATLDGLTDSGDVRSADLVAALPDGWTPRLAADALRPYGVAVGNVTVGGVQAKGYRREQVKRAVQQVDGTAGRTDADGTPDGSSDGTGGPR